MSASRRDFLTSLGALSTMGLASKGIAAPMANDAGIAIGYIKGLIEGAAREG